MTIQAKKGQRPKTIQIEMTNLKKDDAPGTMERTKKVEIYAMLGASEAFLW